MNNIENTIDNYKDAIIQIVTQFGAGSGFYLSEFNLIVTNKHVVAGTNEVAVSGNNFKKQVTSLLFSDPLNDLAFLKKPENVDFPSVKLADDDNLKTGEQIIAIGHPYGLKYTATQGIVSKADRIYNNIQYIQIDAAINPGNSGGPLLNTNGELVGVNTFIIANGNHLGFAVPVSRLRASLNDYLKVHGELATRCPSCSFILTESKLEGEYCSNCGNKIAIEDIKPAPFQPQGIHKTIETIITKLGKDIKLCRVGPNSWDIEEGSALIKVDYNPDTKFIIGDVHLCKIPKENIGRMYEFLLKENYNLEGLVFSINKQSVILSLLIFFEDLTIDIGFEQFNNIVKKTNYYTNILIQEYSAIENIE